MAECFTLQQRLALLQAHGSGCLAYSTLQPGLNYFDVAGIGYVAYYLFRHPILAQRGRRLVIGEPICGDELLSDLVDQFVATGPPVLFLQVGDRVATHLHSKGYRVNQLGVETDISLQDFTLDGKLKTRLRHWRNKALKEGVVISERPVDAIDRTQIAAVSADWLSRKGQKELRLLTRPLCYEREHLVRYFWAHQRDRLVGLTVFDPLCRDNDVWGYYHNMVRLIKGAPNGTSDLMTLAAIETFRTEGVRTLSFGLSPLACITISKFQANVLTHVLLLLLYRYGQRLYPFAGNYTHKTAYGPVMRPVYVSGNQGNSIIEVISTMKAIGVL
jgi:lysylphosphatidylglycerol synthetase-like protein (DUF2156 family)